MTLFMLSSAIVHLLLGRSLAYVCPLERGKVELLHLEHGLHRALALGRIWVPLHVHQRGLAVEPQERRDVPHGVPLEVGVVGTSTLRPCVEDEGAVSSKRDRLTRAPFRGWSFPRRAMSGCQVFRPARPIGRRYPAGRSRT